MRGQVPVKVLLGAGAGAGLSPAFAADMGRRPGFPATIRRIEALAAARPARRGLAAAVQG